MLEIAVVMIMVGRILRMEALQAEVLPEAHLPAAETPALLMTLGAWITKNVAKKKAIPKPLVTPYKILSTFALTITLTLNNVSAKRA